MSWQEGDGPAPEPPDRPLGADEHMSLAQGYLAAAEKLRAELVATDPTDEPFDDRIVARITRVRNTSSTLLYSAIDLANAHRAMAVALRDSVPQRIEMRSPFDPDETDRAIREQLAADTEAHQSVTHAPGIDPEPEGSEGDLWTTDGEWFWYAVANHGSDERWIQARYYAHILTWQAAGTRPTPLRWEELRNEDLTGEPDMILRRPTADERSRFYGPEPDPQSAITEQHARTTTIPAPSTLGEAFRTPYATADIADIAAQPYPRYPQVGPFNDPKPSVLTHVVCPKCGFTGRGLYPGERDRRTAKNDPLCPGCARPEPENGTACDCCLSGLFADEGIDPAETVCGMCDHRVVKHARRMPERLIPAAQAWPLQPAPEGPIRFGATVAAFSDEAVAEMARAVEREQAKRGGAAQWREG